MAIFLNSEIQGGLQTTTGERGLQSAYLFGGVSACNYLQSPQRGGYNLHGPPSSLISPQSLLGEGEGCALAKKALQQLKKVFSPSPGVHLSSS